MPEIAGSNVYGYQHLGGTKIPRSENYEAILGHKLM